MPTAIPRATARRSALVIAARGPSPAITTVGRACHSGWRARMTCRATSGILTQASRSTGLLAVRRCGRAALVLGDDERPSEAISGNLLAAGVRRERDERAK